MKAIALITLALGLLCVPLIGEAQPPTKVARVGYLVPTSSPGVRAIFTAFEQELRALGYVEGQNLVIEFRNAEGHGERLPALAAELVQRHVDVLVAGGPEGILRAARYRDAAAEHSRPGRLAERRIPPLQVLVPGLGAGTAGPRLRGGPESRHRVPQRGGQRRAAPRPRRRARPAQRGRAGRQWS